MEPHGGFHEVVIGQRLGLRPLLAHAEGLLEGDAQLRLRLGRCEGEDEIDVPGIEGPDCCRGYGTIRGVAMGASAHRRKRKPDKQGIGSENFRHREFLLGIDQRENSSASAPTFRV
ncbi:hypothetical protein D9M70_544670 [compost metagenome]